MLCSALALVRFLLLGYRTTANCHLGLAAKSSLKEVHLGQLIPITDHHERKSEQALKQEPEGRSWTEGHGGALLTGWLFVVCLACFLTYPGPVRARPSHINHMQKMPQRFAYRPIWWGGGGCICSTEVPLSKWLVSTWQKNLGQLWGLWPVLAYEFKTCLLRPMKLVSEDTIPGLLLVWSCS